MEFQEQAAIWMQIAQQIAIRIMNGEWKPGERIPSVRDLAAEVQVNPNTVVRSVTFLQEEGIIVNQRGIGYFVAEDGPAKAQALRIRVFTEKIVPVFFQTVHQLGIDWDELKPLFLQFQNQQQP